MLLDELLQQGSPERAAIITKNKCVTYKELWEKVASYRDDLYENGVRHGDKVAVLSHNSEYYIYAYFAIASLGAIVIPLNYQLRPREIAYILQDAKAVCMLTEKTIQFDEKQADEEFAVHCPQYLIGECGENKVNIQAPILINAVDENDTCTIIYTSGTTGKPKGAMLTHKNLTRNAAMVEDRLHVNKTDNVLCALPMYHCFAWTCCVLNAFYSGSCITIMENFTPKETIEAISKGHVTTLYVVPSICSLLTKLASRDDLASVRIIVIGGTTLPVSIAMAFSKKFGLAIAEGYGLSEASPVVAVNPPGKERIGSIGKLLSGIEARIVDAGGNNVQIGETGELLIRGDNVMQGYWNLPEATNETIIDGWLHTGDIARQDSDGYFYIVDRIKDMIISMGENVYPREIEELIYSYPGISEAAVIGITDRLRGQAGCCFFSVHEGQCVDRRALKKYLQQKLALYKVPREFYELSELPKTSTGKISKLELEKLYRDGNSQLEESCCQ